jgi:D-psicose/D-tagatose/L-ribulose 3-epimerase
MKYGMNILLWTDDPLTEACLPLYEKLKRMGFDGVEVPIFTLDPARFAALGTRLDDIGLERTAVTVRSPADDPISSDAAVRAKGIELTKRALDCCQAAGIRLLAGPYYATWCHFSGAAPTGDEWKWGVDSMRTVAEYAATAGVTLGLEFLNRFEIYLLNCAADAARFAREVDHPNCRMMYDTFHAHIEEKDIPGAVASCADMLAHVHISENDRSTPGQGQVNWQATFDALTKADYKGWLTIEAFGPSVPTLASATKIWRRMFIDEDQVASEGLRFMRGEWAKRSAARRA